MLGEKVKSSRKSRSWAWSFESGGCGFIELEVFDRPKYLKVLERKNLSGPNQEKNQKDLVRK